MTLVHAGVHKFHLSEGDGLTHCSGKFPVIGKMKPGTKPSKQKVCGHCVRVHESLQTLIARLGGSQ